MPKRFYDIIIFTFILIGLVSAIITLNYRAKAESEYRTVLIALDYFQLHRFARYNGVDINDVLAMLKGDGFNTIALIEDTPEFLEERGIASVVKGFKVEKKVLEGPESIKNKEKPEITKVTEDKLVAEYLGLPPNQVHVLFHDQSLRDSFSDAWARRIVRDRVAVHDFPDENIWVVSLDGDPEEMYQLGAGFLTSTHKELTNMGFQIVPRFRNCRDFPSSEILAQKDLWGIDFHERTPVIVDGDEILGYPSIIDSTAESFKNSGFQFGYIEFAKQAGERSFAKFMLPNVVRVHSISDEEMEIYTPAKAVARFLRAVRERNVRVVYLKPFFVHGQNDDPLLMNITYFKSVRDVIAEDGYQFGIPESIKVDSPPIPKSVSNILASLAIGAGVLLLIALGWGVRSIILMGLAIIVAVLTVSSGFSSMLIKLFGLAAGVVFPVLGLAWIFHHRRVIGKFPDVVTGFLAVILGSIIGGLINASLFVTPSYMLEIDSYSGVKLTFILPVFIAAIICVRLFFREQSSGLLKELLFLGDMEIKIKHLVLLAIVGFAGLILLTRSGNEPLFAVSNVENSIRGLMETIMSVRPRTKEFLIGHPLMILGLYFLYKDYIRFASLAFLAVVGGIIGQVSIFNTFCHFHTPLSISLLRTVYGLVAGVLLGILLIVIVSGIVKYFFKPAQK